MYNTISRAIALLVLFYGSLYAAYSTAMPKPENPELANRSILPAIKYKNFDSAKSLGTEAWQGLAKVYIGQPTLAFSKRWARDHRFEMSKRDEERIRTKYSDALRESLEKAYIKQGWQLVEEPGKNTLVIKPSLSDMRISAPDLTQRPRTRDFVEYAGSTSLTLSFSNPSRGMIGLLKDHDETNSLGGVGDLKQTNRVVNYRDFKRLFDKWAGRSAKFAQKQSNSVVASAN